MCSDCESVGSECRLKTTMEVLKDEKDEEPYVLNICSERQSLYIFRISCLQVIYI